MKNKNKIVLDLDAVRKIVADLRARDKKIVLTQGSFDMVHIGHARYCNEAKKHGDVLLVGVDSDEKVRHRKGADRPVVPQAERLEMLTYLESVDYVVLKELNNQKYSLIEAVQPDVLIATKETYTDKQITNLEEKCGKVVVLEPMATTSTSAKLRRLQIGMAEKIATKLSKRMQSSLQSVLDELTQ